MLKWFKELFSDPPDPVYEALVERLYRARILKDAGEPLRKGYASTLEHHLWMARSEARHKLDEEAHQLKLQSDYARALKELNQTPERP